MKFVCESNLTRSYGPTFASVDEVIFRWSLISPTEGKNDLNMSKTIFDLGHMKKDLDEK